MAEHDPPVALALVYRMFTTLLSWLALCTRSDSTKEIEIPGPAATTTNALTDRAIIAALTQRKATPVRSR